MDDLDAPVEALAASVRIGSAKNEPEEHHNITFEVTEEAGEEVCKPQHLTHE